VTKVFLYITHKNILKRREIYVSRFLIPFLLTLLNFHLVVPQPFAPQKSGQKSWLTFTMEQLNHPV